MVDGVSPLPTPEELAARGLRRLLRGGTWLGLARELAWEAVQRAGGGHADLDWLTPLIEARLAEQVDGLEFTVDRAVTAAEREHRGRRPHDRDGAELVACAEGYRGAVERLVEIYLEQLEWAAALIAERRQGGRGRRRSRSISEPAVELPQDLADELAEEYERFGWPRPEAA
jgi:hypothetical protein